MSNKILTTLKSVRLPLAFVCAMIVLPLFSTKLHAAETGQHPSVGEDADTQAESAESTISLCPADQVSICSLPIVNVSSPQTQEVIKQANWDNLICRCGLPPGDPDPGVDPGITGPCSEHMSLEATLLQDASAAEGGCSPTPTNLQAKSYGVALMSQKDTPKKNCPSGKENCVEGRLECRFDCAPDHNPNDPTRCELVETYSNGADHSLMPSPFPPPPYPKTAGECLAACIKFAVAKGQDPKRINTRLYSPDSCPKETMPPSCLPTNNAGNYPQCPRGTCFGICTMQSAGGQPLTLEVISFEALMERIMAAVCSRTCGINDWACSVLMPMFVTAIPGWTGPQPVSSTNKDLQKLIAQEIQNRSRDGRCSFLKFPDSLPGIIGGITPVPIQCDPAAPETCITRANCAGHMKSVQVCSGGAIADGKDCKGPCHVVQMCVFKNKTPPPAVGACVFDPNDSQDKCRPISFQPQGCNQSSSCTSAYWYYCNRINNEGQCTSWFQSVYNCFRKWV